LDDGTEDFGTSMGIFGYKYFSGFQFGYLRKTKLKKLAYKINAE
jgi:hypothetical protein